MNTIIDKQQKSIELMNFLFTIVNKSMEFVDKKIHAQINALRFKISKDEKEAAKFIDTVQSSLTNFSSLSGSMILMAERKGHTYYYDKAIRKIVKAHGKNISKLMLEKLNSLLVKYREILLDFYNHVKSTIAPLDYFAELFDFGSERNLSLKKVAQTVKKYSEIFKDRYVELAAGDGEQIVKHIEAVGSAEHDSLLNTLHSIVGSYDENDESTYFSMNVYGGNINKWVSSSRLKHVISEHTTKINMIQRDIKSESFKKVPNYYNKIIQPALDSIIGKQAGTYDVDIVANICKQANVYEPIEIQLKSLQKILNKFDAYISELPAKYMNDRERKLYLDELQKPGSDTLDHMKCSLKNIQTVDTAIVISRAARRFADINSIHEKSHIKQQINEVKQVSKKPESNTRYKLLSEISKLVKKIEADLRKYNGPGHAVSLHEVGSDKLHKAFAMLKKYSKAEIGMLKELYARELLARDIAVNISQINKKLLRILDPANTDTCILHASVNVSSLLAHDVLKSVISKRFADQSHKLLQSMDSITEIGGVPCSKIYDNRISISDLTSVAHKFTQYT